MRFLCKIGFHRWTRWEQKHKTVRTLIRTCECCETWDLKDLPKEKK